MLLSSAFLSIQKMVFSTKLLGEATKISVNTHSQAAVWINPGLAQSGSCAEAVLNKACDDCFSPGTPPIVDLIYGILPSETEQAS